MLVKTDFCENVRRAKITLECRLRQQFYCSSQGSYAESGKIDLDEIAEELRDIEYDFINNHDKTTTILSAVTPVGDNDAHEWLVVELTDTDWNHQDEVIWRDFLAEAAAKIIVRLASEKAADGCIATVDTGSTRFVVMEDPDHGHGDYLKHDYIFI